MLDIGQKYAAGMGGFPSMEPVATPRAVQQARDIGIPGFGDAAGAAPCPDSSSGERIGAAAGPPMSPEEYQRQLAQAGRPRSTGQVQVARPYRRHKARSSRTTTGAPAGDGANPVPRALARGRAGGDRHDRGRRSIGNLDRRPGPQAATHGGRAALQTAYPPYNRHPTLSGRRASRRARRALHGPARQPPDACPTRARTPACS